MMKAKFILGLLLFASVFYCFGQDSHILGDLIYRKPTSADSIENRLLDITNSYKKYLPLPRVAIFNIGYPKDVEEYNSLNGYCVLEIVCLSQKENELPIAGLRVITDKGIQEIALLFSIGKIQIDNQQISDSLGKYQHRFYYLIKYSTLHEIGTIVFDWNMTRKNFTISKLPIDDTYGYISANESDENADQFKAQLAKFITREFEVDIKNE